MTGCGSGIGRATAREFDDRGWTVYATDPDPDALTDLGGDCETAELDVTEAGDAERVVADIEERHGRLDCVVNNAGYGQIGPLEELPPDRFREQFEVNVFGQHRVLRAALPVMREQGDGTVINVSSVAGRTALPGQAAYCSSKWAVEGMSDALRLELADHGIDVAVIEPGPVETEFGRRALAEKEHLERSGGYGWFYRAYDGDRYDRRLLDRGIGYVQPPRAAGTIVDAAEAEDPDRRYVVGPWKAFVLAGRVVPDAVRDAALGLVRKLP